LRRDAPVWLLVGTAACFVLVNLVLAQVIVLAFYPEAGTRFGPAALGALCVAAIVCAIYTARGWRSYLRRPPDE
jgi:hypothetical protein